MHTLAVLTGNHEEDALEHEAKLFFFFLFRSSERAGKQLTFCRDFKISHVRILLFRSPFVVKLQDCLKSDRRWGKRILPKEIHATDINITRGVRETRPFKHEALWETGEDTIVLVWGEGVRKGYHDLFTGSSRILKGYSFARDAEKRQCF